MSTKFVLGNVILGLSLMAAGLSHAKDPVRFVVPYPAGGAADQITRLVSNEAAKHYGTSIIIENKPGAAGMIAADQVARSAPDGKTYYVGSNAPLVVNMALYQKMPYDPEKAFIPVAGMGKAPLLLVTKPTLGAKDVTELISLSKDKNQELSMGSASSGNITHLAGEYASKLMGLKVMHVPFTGSAPAMTNLMGGQIDIMFDALPSSLQQALSGKAVPLAILDHQRFPKMPDVPTLKELGYQGAEASAWFGVVAPTGTDDSIVIEMNQAINKALENPELIEKLQQIGAQPMPGSAKDFAAFIAEERGKWIPLAKELNLKAD